MLQRIERYLKIVEIPFRRVPLSPRMLPFIHFGINGTDFFESTIERALIDTTFFIQFKWILSVTSNCTEAPCCQ